MCVEYSDVPAEQVAVWLQAMVGRRVAAIGDGMIDAYLSGTVSRISPEGPVPVLNVKSEELRLGGVANVAKCLIGYGADVDLCCVTGEDAEAEVLSASAASLGINTAGVVADPSRPTTLKTRVVAHRQQVIRLDREVSTPLSSDVEQRLIDNVRRAVRESDAVVLSDYSKGALSESVCREAIREAQGKPILADPKGLPWHKFRGATIFKPNRPESELFLGCDISTDSAQETCARRIVQDVAIPHVLLTCGRDGMVLVSDSDPSYGRATPQALRFAARPRDLVDVTGAGDTVAATLILALSAGLEVAQAAWLSNVAAGIKVGKFGAATVSGQEILQTLTDSTSDSNAKLMNQTAAADYAARIRSEGKTVAFTNGCFDLLHAGHVSYLEHSRNLADALIVGINSDASVHRLKGAGRPVQPEADRARVLSSLACIDAVVLFDEDTPIELIKAVRPNVLTKGADYESVDRVIGWDVVQSWGGRVELVELVSGKSTTSLIAKLST